MTGSELRPEQWNRVNAIFDDAVLLAHDARCAFVLNACAGDEGLRERVERLLVAHDRSDGFLADSVVSRIVPQILEGELASERRIGPYRLLREIGHGGMGTVYLAERSDAEYEKGVA